MKRIFYGLLSIIMLAGMDALAQAPAKFNYQGIARNSSGAPLANQSLGLKISILDNSSSGTAAYVETQDVTTNAYGLYTVAIGSGTAVTGTMEDINWSNGNKYIKVELDPTGGSDYTTLGTTELLSVPYALYAAKSNLDTAGGDLTGTYPNPAIGSSKVTTAKIANGAVTAAKLNAMSATSGQVLKYNGTAWAPAADANTVGWGLTGNATTAAQFIGTTNGQPLQLKVNNEKAGLIEYSGGENTAFGYESLNANYGSGNDAFGSQALSSNTNGGWNTAIGGGALLANTTGDNNTATGYLSLSHNTTAGNNTATGYEALFGNTTGNYNTAFGSEAMRANTTGGNNTSIGYYTLHANTTGGSNTAIGYFALNTNTTAVKNTAIGYNALKANTTGDENTSAGYGALQANSTGYYNTATGAEALYHNTTGHDNVANGYQALYQNTTGTSNVATGNNCLVSNTTGSYNTAIGYGTFYTGTGQMLTLVGSSASVNASNHSNSGAFGYDATITANNQYRIGNSSVTSIGGQVGWTSLSDGRFKTDIQENVPGLDFIKLLRPVTYYFDTKKLDDYLGVTGREAAHPESGAKEEKLSQPQLQTGFIAQEVEAAAQKAGFDFNGVDKPQNDKDIYGLRYAEFVVPLVKAVQEQQAMIEKQQDATEQQQARIKQLETAVEKQQQEINDLKK